VARSVVVMRVVRTGQKQRERAEEQRQDRGTLTTARDGP